ncbi:MAG TPA: glycosyltransferase family 39 protein [Polyangia bacterium]|nr:glycosyltransferase family 39 protein [Polyangia bacterium]
MSGRARRAILLLAICAGLRIVSLVRPCLSDDEATYCVVAREMLQGRVLYRDVVDHKPPLIYVTYAATETLGGREHGMFILHLLTILVVWATALVLGKITERATATPATGPPRDAGDEVPFAASLLFVIFTTTLLDFDALAANCELYMLLPLTASVLCYLRGFAEPRRAWLATAGLLVGVAMLYKYQAAVQLPLYAIHLGLVHRRRWAALLGGWLAVALGFAVPVGLCLWMMRRAGALDGALFWFSFNAAYIKQGMRISEVAARALRRVPYGILPALFLWILAVRAAVLRWRGRQEDPTAVFLVWWLAVSALATTAGGRFFGHYFHQVTPPLAVLAAPGAVRIWQRRRPLGVVAVGVPAAVFLLIGLFHAPAARAVGALEPDYATIARFIRARSRPSDPLVVWGNVPVLYFEAQRPLGSRFVFSNYLTGLSPATRTQSDPTADASVNVVSESWEMFVSDLASRLPSLFVDTSPGNLGAYGKFPPARFPRLSAIIDRNYTLVGEVAGARVFARRQLESVTLR